MSIDKTNDIDNEHALAVEEQTNNLTAFEEGGYIIIANATDNNWVKTYQHSYQMKSWKNFPDEIKAKTTTEPLYIGWDQTPFKDWGDGSGDVRYQLEKTKETLEIQGRYKTLSVVFKDFTPHNTSINRSYNIGWRHDGCVSFILTGTKGNYYTSAAFDGSNWMSNMGSLLRSKKIREICMLGSHDAGMSVYTSGTPFGYKCNTLTQTEPIKKQLEYGARYFDIRPVISAGEYYTGHYGHVLDTTWQGANGQSIESIVNEVNDFTAKHKELVILNLSHTLNTDIGNLSYRPFTQKEWDGLFEKLSKLRYLFMRDDITENSDLTKLRVDEYISGRAAVLLIIEGKIDGKDVQLGKYSGKGFFQQKGFYVYNEYSNSTSVRNMAADQLEKMRNFNRTYQNYSAFLLSWTLTQTPTQAATCNLPNIPSILQLASEANERVVDFVYNSVNSKNYPNILYMDRIADCTGATLVCAINNKIW